MSQYAMALVRMAATHGRVVIRTAVYTKPIQAKHWITTAAILHAIKVVWSLSRVTFYEAYQHHGWRESECSGVLTAGQNSSIRGDTPLIVVNSNGTGISPPLDAHYFKGHGVR